MRGITLAVGAAALFAAVGLGRAADDDQKYDLRGPAPEKGWVLVSKAKVKIKDADATMKVMGQEVTLKLDVTDTTEEEAKVLAVEGRNVTRCQTKIIKQKTDTVATVGGQEIPHDESRPLEGETVLSERDGKKWKHSLLDTKPTEKQKKQLASFVGLENDDDLYPEEKVKVGHTWTADAGAFAKRMNSAYVDVKGKLKQKFVAVEELDGEKVAVIESAGKMTAKELDDGEPSVDVELDLKLTTWRSLKTGVALKEKFEGKIKMSGTVKMEDAKVEMTLSGPMSGEATTKLRTKPQ